MIDLTAFCPKCFKKQQIANPKLETTQFKESIVKGNCPDCKTEIASLIPSTTSQKDLEDIEKKKQEEIEKERIKKEKKEVKAYVDDSKIPENKKKLNENGYVPPMKKNYYNLIKFALFLLTIITILFLYKTYYSEDFVPQYSSAQVCGDCSCPEIDIPSCPTAPNCPTCSNECYFPDELNVFLNNET